MSKSTRAHKKHKANDSVCELRNGDRTYRRSAGMMIIADNHPIHEVSNCRYLTSLTLERTDVETISGCPSLFSLTINENDKLCSLHCPSVREAHLSNLENLETVDLSAAEKVVLENLPRLEVLSIPSAKDVTMIAIDGMELERIPLALTTLRLIGVTGIRTFEHLTCGKLYVTDCDVLSINGLNGVDELWIDGCQRLAEIRDIGGATKLTVVECPNLTSLRDIRCVESVSVSRCDRLQRVRNIESGALSIEYCSAVRDLDLDDIASVDIRQCPSLLRVALTPATVQLSLDTCPKFESLETEHEYATDQSQLSVSIRGPCGITIIEDWYVRFLSIMDSSVQVVRNVYDLESLELEDCLELSAIANVHIRRRLRAVCCPELTTLTEVYGPRHLYLHDCEALESIGVYMKPLSISIQRCWNLRVIIDGELLRSVLLNDIGFAFIRNLSKRAEVDVHNVPLLPDLDTSELMSPAIYELLTTEEALELRARMETMLRAVRSISAWHQRRCQYKAFKRYLRAQRAGSIDNCSICYDAIDPRNFCFTPCDHLYHKSCLSTWRHIRRSCPLCNGIL